MASTLVRKVMLRIAADDGDTEEKLDKISEKADELGRKHPELRVKVDTAAASAKMAVLRKELKATDQQADQTGGRFKALGQVLNIGLLGGISGGIGEMSTFQKAMMGLNLATGLGEPAVAGLAVAVGGLSSGLVAGGLGLGAFGLVAKGVFAQVTPALQAFETAQSTSGKASKTAMTQYQAYMKALTPAQREVVHSLAGADSAWQGFVNKNTAGVATIMSKGIGLLPKVFSALQPFLAPTEKALSGLIGEMSKGMSGSGFKSWISSFAQASGPMITNLGHAIGHIVVGIGGVLKAFLPMASRMTGGLDSITAKFAKWGTTLGSHSGFQSLMQMFKSDTPLLISDLKQIGSLIKTVGSNMAGMSTFSNSKLLLQSLRPVLSVLNKLAKVPGLVDLVLYLKLASDAGKKLHTAVTGVSDGLSALSKGKKYVSDFAAGFGDAEKAAKDATGAAGTMGGKFSSVLSSVGGWAKSAAVKLGLMKTATAEATAATEAETGAQEGLDGAMDANPVGLIVLAIAGLVIAFVELWKHCAAFRDFWKAVWKDVQKVAVAAFHLLEDGVKAYVKMWQAEWDIVKTAAKDVWHFIEAAFKDGVKILKRAWDDVKSDARAAWDFLKSLVDREVNGIKTILHWFAGLGSLMHRYWDDMINAVHNVIYGKLLPFVRELPGRILSGLGDMGRLLWNAGLSVIRGFLGGLKAAWHDVTSFIGGIGSWIAAHKGPLSVDAVLLRPHGKAIIDGLIAGMKSQMPALAAQLTQIVSKLKSTINQAKSYAASVTSSALSAGGLQAITGNGNKRVTGTEIEAGLHRQLATIRRFSHDLKKLKEAGLSGALLQQIIAMGPQQGDQYAQAILSSGISKQISRTYGMESSAAARLGTQASADIYGGRIARTLDQLDKRLAKNSKMQIEWLGGGGADQQFLTWIKRNIRIRGGDPGNMGR